MTFVSSGRWGARGVRRGLVIHITIISDPNPFTLLTPFSQVWTAVLQQLLVQCRPKHPKRFNQFTTREHVSYASGCASKHVTTTIEAEYDVVKSRPQDYRSMLENPLEGESSSAEDIGFIFNKTVIIFVFLFRFLSQCSYLFQLVLPTCIVSPGWLAKEVEVIAWWMGLVCFVNHPPHILRR
jgi:hypothetical protein